MLSRQIELEPTMDFKWQQNRFAILLVLTRSRISPEEYRVLLRAHAACRQMVLQIDAAGQFEIDWVYAWKEEIDGAFAAVEAHRFPSIAFARLLHLFRDLLLRRTGIAPQVAFPTRAPVR